MAEQFTLPNLGEGFESGDVAEVLVEEGQVIEPGQDVIEVETEKAVVPVPCPLGGRVVRLLVNRGDTVKEGTPILEVEAAESPAEETPPEAEAPAVQQAPAAETPAEPTPAAAPADTSSDGQPAAAPSVPTPAAPAVQPAPAPAATAVAAAPGPGESTLPPPASPEVRRRARELGINIYEVQGTGPGGRITMEDVERTVRQRLAGLSAAPAVATATVPLPPAGTAPGAATAPEQTAAEQDAFGPVRREPMPKIRETIARNMVRSVQTIPHVTNFDQADITELDRIRRESMADYSGEVKLTLMPFIIKAVALALKRHETLNASLDMENRQIIYKQYVNLGIAVDTPRGLVVPVLRNADRLSIRDIAFAMHEMVQRVRDGRFSMDELRGGTFTISNLGAIGGMYSTPIINHPEVAILLTGRGKKMPVVVDDQIQVRLILPLSLSYDHRLVDGATAGRFLNEVIGFLENPGRLLLAP